MSIYPDDSASQVDNIAERNERFNQEIEHTQESQAEIASRIRDNVKAYMGVSDKIKKVLAATRELRKERVTLEKKLISDMRSLDVENLQLNQGQLVAKRSTPKVPLTKSAAISALSKNLEDPELIDTIMDILYNKRDRYEKVELAHYSKKQK